MSRLGRMVSVVGVAVPTALLALTGPAHAGGFQQCINQAANHNGEPPTCTKVGGQWVASWPDDPTSAGGIPGWFVGVFVLVIVLGIATTVWRVTTAQKLAKQSGMDPGLATRMTLLTDDGLDATYLASSLRGQQQPPASATPAPAAQRLDELKGLLDAGRITQTEYDQRRQAIIDAV